MSSKEVVIQQTPEILPEENEQNQLPTLLSSLRRTRQCKTSHGIRNGKLAPDSKSTGGSQCKRSFEGSKSFCAKDSKSTDESGLDDSVTPDQCQKAFPTKVVPLKRSRAAAKIQDWFQKFKKFKGRAMSDQNPDVGAVRVEILEPSSKTQFQYWPEGPEAPTQEELEALAELQAVLIEQHGTFTAAYKFICGCTYKGHDAFITKRELRLGLRLKACQGTKVQGDAQSDAKSEDLFNSLLRLFRRSEGHVSKAEFSHFPELLSHEKALHERVSNGVLVGFELRDQFMQPIESSDDALELLQKAAVALELEPARTANMLYQIANAAADPSGLISAMTNITRMFNRFVGPKPGKQLETLLASWNLCGTLARQVKALGASPAVCAPSSKNQTKTTRSWFGSKSTNAAKKYQCKVDVSTGSLVYGSHLRKRLLQKDEQTQTHAQECDAAFWQALPTGEVLINLAYGAEVLDDEDFKTLLNAAWELFDNFDAITCLLGPVGLGRMRRKLDELLAINLEPHVLGNVSEHGRSQLENVGLLLSQITSMCKADPRLARDASLFGASFLADRIRCKANALVNFADAALCSAVAQVNRSAATMVEQLRSDVEELLEGRKVVCYISSGEYKIVPSAPPLETHLAKWHQQITAEVLANARAKGYVVTPSRSEEPDQLRSMEKFLIGYSNLQES